jgi:hypothetical protein
MCVYVYIYTEREREERKESGEVTRRGGGFDTCYRRRRFTNIQIPSDITQYSNTQILQENNENSSTQISEGGGGARLD